MSQISVIIPVHNDEKYVEQCIDSVRKQTLKDVQIICVDDGSEDNSCSVIQGISKTDNRVLLLTQSNRGAGVARNHGLKFTEGEYVLFLDADDFYDDATALEKLYYNAKKEGALICAAYMKYYRNNRFTDAEYFRDINVSGASGKWVRFADMQQDWGFTCYLYSVEMIKKNKILFPEYSVYEDPVFFLKCMEVAKKFYLVPVNLYCYRQGHHTRIYTKKAIQDILKGIKENLQVSNEAGYQKLYDLLVKRLNDNYRQRILDHLSVEAIEELINIKNYDAKTGHSNKFKLLEDVENIVEDCRYDLQRIAINEIDIHKEMDNSFIFPFHMFTKGVRVVIYGSGEIGESFYRQARCLDYVNIVGIVDKISLVSNSDDIEIKDVKELNRLSFDYVLIAAQEKNIAIEMKKDVLSMGVRDSCVVWDGDSYSLNRFCQKIYIPMLQKRVK